jgi:y4mF family transcriptional regulator
MDISAKIKEIRKKAGLTQIEFARRAGIGLRFVRDLEQGKKTIRLDKLNQVIEFFGYHIDIIKNGK